ncbi:MAG: hypothetical protein CFE21_19975 [Bacteroidetes bacterium B1(2017)]|nr:MAG: hypothetical protein CFE21_19975 [Bacteroidetes bacterium B1(2017)]
MKENEIYLEEVYEKLLNLLENESDKTREGNNLKAFNLKEPVKMELHINNAKGFYSFNINEIYINEHIKIITVFKKKHCIEINFGLRFFYKIEGYGKNRDWDLTQFIEMINNETNSNCFPIYRRNNNLKNIISEF